MHFRWDVFVFDFHLCRGESQHLLNRRLQSPFDIFECPGSTCSVPPWYVNDRYCDCPGCEDEAFTCDTCIPTEPFGTQMATDTQTDLGVAVGVGLGVAVGVGLGVGLGVSAAVGGAFAAVGFVQFTVSNAQESLQWDSLFIRFWFQIFWCPHPIPCLEAGFPTVEFLLLRQ